MAYTPGLKRLALALVRKTRVLPVRGKVLTKVGDKVSADTVIAEVMIPGPPVIVNAASQIGVEPDELALFVVKKEGDKVRKGETLAKYRAFWGLMNKESAAPIDGVVEHISNMSGQIILRESPTPLAVKAYIPGNVIQVMQDEGAVVETPAAFIQGIFGIGGETHGEMRMLERDVLRVSDLSDECRGKIVIVRGTTETGALRKAATIGAKALVIACIEEKELSEFMGSEIGVAITGSENVGLTLIVTEGFGKELVMPERTYELFQRFQGHEASINGATQIRAGVIRPEIIIPQPHVETGQLKGVDVVDTSTLSEGLRPGTRIRIISNPHFGALGKVIDLPSEPQMSATESKVRVLEAELLDGKRVFVPRANVEILEEQP